MNAEITEYIASVKYAASAQPMQPKETLMSHEPTGRPSDRPWEKAAVDIYMLLMEKDYLITVEYITNFWESDRFRDTNASTCVRKLKSHFARKGILEVLI